MHFMVTQGLGDRKTLRVNYPLANKKLSGRRVRDRLLEGPVSKLLGLISVMAIVTIS